MHSVLAFVSAHQALLIALALLAVPALITGLSRYPKAAGVVKVLQVFFDVFSVVVHADSPGTLKLPLTRSQPPLTLLSSADDAANRQKGFVRPGALVSLLFFSAAFLVVVGCSWTTQQWKDFGAKVLAQGGACAVKVATDEAGKVANGLLDSIESAIAKGQSPTDWAALGETAAIDAGTCIGADLLDDYLNSKTAGPALAPKCRRGGHHRAPGPQHEAYLRALLRVK